MRFTRPLARKKNLLLCFDAFDTLYKPNVAVPAAYAFAAKRHGIDCVAESVASQPVESWSEKDYEPVYSEFKKTFKQQAVQNPNYGKATGLGAEKWWANVIQGTFQPFLKPQQEVPDALVSELLTRYSSSEGYDFFPDAKRLFQTLKTARTGASRSPSWRWDKTIVGVITNSDDRVPSILTSFGLKVGPHRAGVPNEYTPVITGENDIDFVALSYDVGHEKPDRRIFDAATDMLTETIKASPASAGLGCVDDYEKLYVGDSVENDYFGSMEAGWHAVRVDRSVAVTERGGDEVWRNEPLETKLVRYEGKRRKMRIVRGLDELVRWTPKNRWSGDVKRSSRAGRMVATEVERLLGQR